ncbi:MAG: hypothetical protein ABGY09_03525 [Euryarchaeota archaeon]
MGRRVVEWPVYPRGNPAGLGIVLSSILYAPFVAAALPLLILGIGELSGKVDWDAVLLGALGFVVNAAALPLGYRAVSSLIEGVVVRPDGLEVRVIRRRFVRVEEISEVEVSEGWVIVRTVDGRRLRLGVFDREGFVETLREVWGVES